MTRRAENGFKLPFMRKAVGVFGRLLWAIAMLSKDAKCLRNTKGTQAPADLGRWFWQRLIGINGGAYWPMHPSSTVSYAQRIHIGIETSPGWSPGCMIHGVNGIIIGDYTQISQNVAILSGNHDPYALPKQLPAQPIRIGKYCLLGFNSVIMPGVELGDYTIVGANAVVTRSFPDGYVVLAGAPASPVKTLEPELARDHVSAPHQRYHGYVSAADFPEFAKNNLG
ncbi:acyltransferase [Mameliella sp. CS4]|uniref:acyltransferase n=1 Tax=Mameliella sp. CS4 TaxID=2862329 RepID=UPI001C5D326E|nr:acyltransferase [Mameliella sp. CS4]MBW4985698.1 acyltransferase [Mameliella sp. CS4]